MSNTTNPESWAALERLRFVERSLWWRGQVKRKDLGEGFGISLAQASSDLQRYLEMNPLAARYDLKAKTYWGEPHMECLLHAPRLEEGLGLYLGGAGAGGLALGALTAPGLGSMPGNGAGADRGGTAPDRVARVTLPLREAGPAVQRAAFFAVYQGLRFRVAYGSLTGRRSLGWRWLVPHAFAHDGYRWHLRAWCEENGEHRDFVLSRIRQAEWPVAGTGAAIPADVDWESWEELTLVANPELPEDLRKAVESDFGMRAGRLRLPVRRAMKAYTLDHLRLRTRGGKGPPQWLCLEEG